LKHYSKRESLKDITEPEGSEEPGYSTFIRNANTLYFPCSLDGHLTNIHLVSHVLIIMEIITNSTEHQ